MYVASIALLVCSGVLYQLFQKLINPMASPIFSLICTYSVAIVASALLLLVVPLKGTIAAELKNVNIYSFLLAIPIIGIELGYLLLYRAGGNFSYSSALVSSMITFLLVVIGIAVFKEAMSVKKMIGLVFCIAGIALLNIK